MIAALGSRTKGRNFKGFLRPEIDIFRTELRGEALHRRACNQIMLADTRHHGRDCQGVRRRKVARMEARAFKPFGLCSRLSVHGSTSNNA
jgi:hypothetical protein